MLILVFEANGRVLAFLGVTPRPFTFRGRPIRAAIATNFMSDPGPARAGIGAATIVRKLLDGPQDLSLCDGTFEVRAMWEPLGAITTAITGLGWRLPLRPTLLSPVSPASRAPRRMAARPLTGEVAAVVDPLMRRSAGLPFRLAPADASTRSVGVRARGGHPSGRGELPSLPCTTRQISAGWRTTSPVIRVEGRWR